MHTLGLLVVGLVLACSAGAQSVPKRPQAPATKPAQPALKPTQPSVKAAAQLAGAQPNTLAKPSGEDPIRGEEYLFKMAAALIKPGTPLGLVSTEGKLKQYNPSLAGGSFAVDFTAGLSFPDRMRMKSEVMGRTVSIELVDSTARSIVGGMGQVVPSAELLAELARHYINIARMCKQLKAVYLGSPVLEKVRLLHLRVQLPSHRHGPVELLLDPKTFLPRLIRFNAVDPFTLRVEPTEERLSNWQMVAGVRMAYQREVYYGGRLVTEEQLTRHTIVR